MTLHEYKVNQELLQRRFPELSEAQVRDLAKFGDLMVELQTLEYCVEAFLNDTARMKEEKI